MRSRSSGFQADLPAYVVHFSLHTLLVLEFSPQDLAEIALPKFLGRLFLRPLAPGPQTPRYRRHFGGEWVSSVGRDALLQTPSSMGNAHVLVQYLLTKLGLIDALIDGDVGRFYSHMHTEPPRRDVLATSNTWQLVWQCYTFYEQLHVHGGDRTPSELAGTPYT
jgi:hypothetical protein